MENTVRTKLHPKRDRVDSVNHLDPLAIHHQPILRRLHISPAQTSDRQQNNDQRPTIAKKVSVPMLRCQSTFHQTLFSDNLHIFHLPVSCQYGSVGSVFTFEETSNRLHKSARQTSTETSNFDYKCQIGVEDGQSFLHFD